MKHRAPVRANEQGHTLSNKYGALRPLHGNVTSALPL